MKRPIYPLLLSIYPVVSLLATNVDQMKLVEGLRALLLLFAIGGLLFFLLKLILHDANRAALVFSFLWVLFFSYGHVYSILERTPVFGLTLGRHRWMVPLWVILLAVGVFWALTRKKDLTRLTQTLNVAAIVLLVMPVLQIALAEAKAQIAWSQREKQSLESGGLEIPPGQTPPDVYYIILDAYARGDVLQDTFGYDNTSFLEGLEAMGFYVADCSQSNYAQTELSLVSSLNMNYLEALDDHFTPDKTGRTPLRPLLQASAVRQILENMGYQTVAFETGYSWSQLEDADVYLTRSTKVTGLNEFEVLLVESSASLVLNDAASALPKFLVPAVDYPKHNHRERVLSTLDKLSKVPSTIDSPKYVFAHIIAPHIPFVFGPQGEPIVWPEKMDIDNYEAGYRAELAYLNQRVLTFVQDIISNSDSPPVIILQADHGRALSSPQIRMQILNAYYLPGAQPELLYPDITPVNTFRIIFNQYFGGQYELLEDHSYFSIYKQPYLFEEIPNQCIPIENSGQ